MPLADELQDPILEPVSTVRPKRRFGLSLRVTLGLMAILAIALAIWVNQIRQIRAGLALIKAHHGEYHFDFEYGEDAFVAKPTSWAPNWLRELVGDESLHHVTYVRIVDDGFDDAEFASLIRCFPRIRALGIDGAAITDPSLELLRGNPYLAGLFVKSPKITDAGMDRLDVNSLPLLSRVDIRGTQVTDSRADQVEKVLQDREAATRRANPGKRVDSHFVLRGPFHAMSIERERREQQKKLEAKYPLKGKGRYILQMDNPYLLLNRAAFEAAGLREQEAEGMAKTLLEEVFTSGLPTAAAAQGSRKEAAVLTHVFTLAQMRDGQLPNTQYGRLVAHSYSPYVGWALHVNFGPYQFPWKGQGTTHFSANSYDRHVPLELFGAAFVPGTYHGVVAPVDIAATLASLLRINWPSAAVGNVLTQAMRPDAAGDAVK